MTLKTKNFMEAARFAAVCCDDKKALDILVADVTRLLSLADFYVLATVESSTQLQALQDHIDFRVKQEFGINPVRQDGSGSSQWRVMDYGGFVVHIMHRTAREFYGLERLWEGARPVEWQSVAAPVPVEQPKPSRKTTKTAKKSPAKKAAKKAPKKAKAKAR